MKNNSSIALILLAGGKSSRMGSAIPKPFMELDGIRVVDYSLKIFEQLPNIVEICVVCPEEYRQTFPSTYTFALPGDRRQDSVLYGLRALRSAPDLVAVHDAARPLISLKLVEAVVREASLHGAALAAVPVKATIKVSTATHEVSETPDRSLLWEAQTPQIFKLTILKNAFESPINNRYDAVDDASLVERIGIRPKLVMGSYSNIKLTTIEDLHFAGSLLQKNPCLQNQNSR